MRGWPKKQGSGNHTATPYEKGVPLMKCWTLFVSGSRFLLLACWCLVLACYLLAFGSGSWCLLLASWLLVSGSCWLLVVGSCFLVVVVSFLGGLHCPTARGSRLVQPAGARGRCHGEPLPPPGAKQMWPFEGLAQGLNMDPKENSA